MFHCLHYKQLFQINIHTLKTQSLQTPFLKSHSQTNPPFSLLQYLQHSCGMPPEMALTVSKKLQNKTPKNAESVLTFFESHGFSKVHIKSIISVAPKLLLVAAESILEPKIQFFKEKGLSDSEIVGLITLRPTILAYSLEKSIKPSFNFLHGLLGTDQLVIKSLKRSRFQCNLQKTVIPNIAVLKKCGVPDCRISKLLTDYPATLMQTCDRFGENVKMVREMGFNPSTNGFVEALRVIVTLSRPVWDMKFEVYRSLGWSDEEIMLAFRKHPSCITASEEKIRRAMDFFANELGWRPSYISSEPTVMSLSLEKRIMPRHRFLQSMVSKGLIKKDKKIRRDYFKVTEKQFLESHVMKYQTKFPEALNLYKEIVRPNRMDVKDGE